MRRPARRPALPRPEGKLSIGALSRATGIPAETLRTWERRYGFPVPERRPSGHRVYPVGLVPRLRRIAEALERGHRAGQVVAASETDLSAILDAVPSPGPSPARPLGTAWTPADLLDAVGRFDRERLTSALLADWGLLEPLEFLRDRVAPLVRAAGDAWEAGRLEVRHEHFLSERVGDLLRALRLRFEERARGPLAVFATLPGELHGLGLQMAALLLATVGCRVLYLGTDTPIPELATLAREFGAPVVAVSVSLFTRGAASLAPLRRLRVALPRRVTLLVGGDGAPTAERGLVIIRDLGTLHAWGRRLVATGRAPRLPLASGRGGDGAGA